MKPLSFEQQMLLATRRNSSVAMDEETQSLHQAYLGLADLLEDADGAIDAEALKALIRAAVLLNTSKGTQRVKTGKVVKAAKTPASAADRPTD